MELISLMTDIGEAKVDSRYRLVIVAAQRGRQLMGGSKPQIHSKFAKEVTVALEEALQEKIEYWIGEQARAALKEARLRQQTMPKPKPLIGGPMDISEIKKDLSEYVDDSKREESSAELGASKEAGGEE
jgi:DNA-directed RNA polymerase subunit omega